MKKINKDYITAMFYPVKSYEKEDVNKSYDESLQRTLPPKGGYTAKYSSCEYHVKITQT